MDLFDEVDRPLPFQLPNSDEYSYEWVESSRLFKVSVPGGALSFSSDFLPRSTSDEFVRYLQQNRTVGTTNVDWRAVGQPDLVDFENALEARRNKNVRRRTPSTETHIGTAIAEKATRILASPLSQTLGRPSCGS